jgi:hypothetical protein
MFALEYVIKTAYMEKMNIFVYELVMYLFYNKSVLIAFPLSFESFFVRMWK